MSAQGPRRTQLMGVVLLAAVFVAGGLSGAAIDRALDVRGAKAAETRRGDDRREDGHRHYVFQELNLTPAQEASIDSVLKVRRMQIAAFWDSAGPRMREIVDSTRAGIRSTLTPEQRAEYERLLEERRRRDDERRDGTRSTDGRSDGGHDH